MPRKLLIYISVKSCRMWPKIKVGHLPGEIQTNFVATVQRKRIMSYPAGNPRGHVCMSVPLESVYVKRVKGILFSTAETDPSLGEKQTDGVETSNSYYIETLPT